RDSNGDALNELGVRGRRSRQNRIGLWPMRGRRRRGRVCVRRGRRRRVNSGVARGHSSLIGGVGEGLPFQGDSFLRRNSRLSVRAAILHGGGIAETVGAGEAREDFGSNGAEGAFFGRKLRGRRSGARGGLIGDP